MKQRKRGKLFGILKKRTITFQIQAVLAVVVLIFWHFYILFDFALELDRSLHHFDYTMKVQMQQFVADNSSAMELFDYETIRANASKMTFLYPANDLVIVGNYGEIIFEGGSGSEERKKTVFEKNIPTGTLFVDQNLDTRFSFSQGFPNNNRALITGDLNLNSMFENLLSLLWKKYLVGLLFIVALLGLIFYTSRRITRPLLMFANRLKHSHGEQTWVDSDFATSSELNDLTVAYNDNVRTQLKLRNQLIQSERLAERAKLATQVAHDLKSPLLGIKTAMLYFSQFQNEEKAFSANYNLLTLSADRLSRIVDGLLEQHRDLNELPIHSLLDELIGEYQINPNFSHINFKKQYSDDQPLVFGNKNLLQRAINNILKNATEACTGEGEILVSTCCQNKEVVVQIADNGVGIEKDELTNLLSDDVISNKKSGHGLGLSIVRKIISSYSGKISIESEPKKGTTVTIRLPLWEEEGAQSVLNVKMGKGQILMLVEDDPIIQERWLERLRTENLECVIFNSYEEAKRSNIDSKKIGPAIVDYHFEGSDRTGLDVAKMLMQRGVSDIILCTGDYWKPDLRRKAKKLGLKVCPKPMPMIQIEVGNENTA